MKIVENMNMLKGMERAGHIKFHRQTGTKIKGLYSPRLRKNMFTCYYIDDGEHTFIYKNKTYHTKYFDGCFMPFVVKSQTQ